MSTQQKPKQHKEGEKSSGDTGPRHAITTTTTTPETKNNIPSSRSASRPPRHPRHPVSLPSLSLPVSNRVSYAGVSPNEWEELYGLKKSQSITSKTVMGIGTAWACATLRADACAMIPIRVLKGKGKLQEDDFDHPVWNIFNKTPDGDENAFKDRQSSTLQMLLHGNTVYEIVKNRKGEAKYIFQQLPGMYAMHRLIDGTKQYVLPVTTGSAIFAQDDVLHFAGPSIDNFIGMSIIGQHRKMFERSLLREQHANEFYANGGRPSGVLTTDQRLNPEKRAEIADGWKDYLPNGLAILSNGAHYDPISIPPEDAKFLGSTMFDAKSICQLFRTPPFMVGLFESGSEVKAEELALHFATWTLLAHFRSIEAEVNQKCFGFRSEHRIEFDFLELLRPNNVDRVGSICKQVSAGLLLPDEARAMDKRPPYEGGIGSIPLAAGNNLVRLQDVVDGTLQTLQAGNTAAGDAGGSKGQRAGQAASNSTHPSSDSPILSMLSSESIIKLGTMLEAMRGKSESEIDAIMSRECP